MDGSLPFSWSDLQAFFDLLHLQPRPWEIDLIRSFEDAFLHPKPQEVDHE